jgi:histidinol-phosphatase (PHP family)
VQGVELSPLLLLEPGCDHHVHTKYCRHASGEMEQYVRAGIAKGLQKIIFLEHLEEGIRHPRRTWLAEEDFEAYFEEGRRLQQQYADSIAIGLGVECGYNPKNPEILLEKLSRRTWAEIGISCHFIELSDDQNHLNLFSGDPQGMELARRYGVSKLLTRYLDLLLEAVESLPGTMLCHLDGALRHVPEATMDQAHLQQVEKLLGVILSKGMALELNTSGLKMRGEQFPANTILEMATALGIQVKLSSDAHRPEDVGHAFDIFRTAP